MTCGKTDGKGGYASLHPAPHPPKREGARAPSPPSISPQRKKSILQEIASSTALKHGDVVSYFDDDGELQYLRLSESDWPQKKFSAKCFLPFEEFERYLLSQEFIECTKLAAQANSR